MKCVKNVKDETVIRVSEERAEKLVTSGEYVYAKKGEWKKTGRNK
jgi:hypothetical protein